VTWLLPAWDGPDPAGRVLPEWAQDLSRTCTQYNFTTQLVSEGRSVMARRISGTGPLLVMTRSEDEMRAALGLQPRKPRS
jgi:hypothetical protein